MTIADLFCGAGGTSTGALEAARACGHNPKLTAINHWPVAVATHKANHPDARHLCASLDSLNPRELFREGELDLLWASPECTHHSQARGGKPINDQSRATAWCVTRWPELAAAQGFLPGYRFTGTGVEITKQIGNAVPRRLARAIVAAAIRQDPDVRFLETLDAAKAA